MRLQQKAVHMVHDFVEHIEMLSTRSDRADLMLANFTQLNKRELGGAPR